ncbi:MAG: OprD family outer membrane porin [Sulfurovum sp.]
MPLFAVDTPIGTFKTHIELFYYDINSLEDNENNSYATVAGGFIDYRSKALWGHLGVDIKHYYSHLIFDTKNPNKTSLTDTAGHEINPLAELYLYYQNDFMQDGFMEIRVGKQQLNTPLINSDTTRLIPFSYEAITAKFNFSKTTTLSLGHVYKYRANNSENYTDFTSSGYAENGVSFIGLNTRFGDVEHQWYYFYSKELYNALHIEVKGKIPYDETRDIIYGVQAIYTFKNANGKSIDNLNNGGDNVRLLATKVGLKKSGFKSIFSLSYNFGKDGINRGYGGLSSLYTTSMITSGKKQGNPFAKSLKLKYTYGSNSRKNAYSSALYLTNITYNSADFHTINAIYIDHKFHFRPREYIYLRFERQWIDNVPNRSYFRIISAYEF